MKKFAPVLFLCSAMLLAGCTSDATDSQVTSIEEERPTAVTVQTVKKSSIANGNTFSGRTRAATETSATAQMAGTVSKVHVKVGDTVKAGDVLLTIDATDMNNSIEQAKVALDTAKLSYENTASGNMTSQLNQLNSAVTLAQMGYDEALRNYEIYEQLFEAESITVEQFKQFELALNQAEQQLKSAKDSLELAENTIIPESLALAQKQVDQAQVAYDTAVSSLDKLTITAPASGIITAANFKAGELIAQSTPAFVISNLNSLNVELQVTESDLSKFSVGQSVPVTISGKNLTGKVSEIPKVVTAQTTLYTVKITVDNSEHNFPTGMAAEVILTTEASNDTLLIPKKALIEEEGQTYIYTCVDDTAVKVPVTTGISNQYDIEITSGLEEGTTVVVGGITLIEDGSYLYPVFKED